MNYLAIKDAVKEFANRGDITDALILSWLPLVEQRIYYGTDDREPGLRVQSMLAAPAPLAFTVAGSSAALPADLVSIERLTFLQGGRAIPLDYVPSAPLAPLESNAGTPTWYTVRGNSVYIGPSFDGNLTLLYYKRLVTPSTNSDENALMLRFPTLYVYGLLREVGVWMRDAEFIALYEPMFSSAMKAARQSDEEARRGDTPLVIRSDSMVRV
jgi:hypothetical protein